MSGRPYPPVVTVQEPTPRYPPGECIDWMQARGWSTSGFHPLTGEQLLTKDQSNFYTFAEVMGIEFHRFVNLGAK